MWIHLASAEWGTVSPFENNCFRNFAGYAGGSADRCDMRHCFSGRLVVYCLWQYKWHRYSQLEISPWMYPQPTGSIRDFSWRGTAIYCIWTAHYNIGSPQGLLWGNFSVRGKGSGLFSVTKDADDPHPDYKYSLCSCRVDPRRSSRSVLMNNIQYEILLKSKQEFMNTVL